MDRDDEYSGNDSGNDGGLSNEELSLPKGELYFFNLYIHIHIC